MRGQSVPKMFYSVCLEVVWVSMNRIYLDNAATSFPKPPEVLQAMTHYANAIGASAGRGAYAEARASAGVIRTCRERLNALFMGASPDHFVFGLNCTDALNLAIHGMVREGDHVITTAMDHNSVLRPFHALGQLRGVSQTRVAVDPISGVVDPEDIRKAIRPTTRLIATVHGSNVTGTLQPIREIGRIAREAEVSFLVDAAQTAGHVPISLANDLIDLLAFPGHKALMGPLGTGALYIRPGLEKHLRPVRFGGTGSVSEQDIQPEFMPDKYESGSHNGIGLAGLSAGVAWIMERGVASLYEHDRTLCKAFLSAVDGVEGLRIVGPQGIKDRIGVFSVQVDGYTPLGLATILEEEFGILTRPGLHCAPWAHDTMGTREVGTTRLSFGPFLTVQDIMYAGDALASIALRRLDAKRPASIA